MNKFIFAVAGLFLSSLAVAQAPVSSVATAPGAQGCESRAIDKNGKMLAGAAKKSFMKKCEADSMDPVARNCEAKAMGKNGKALAGAAKSSFMKKCVADAPK
ncbi:hypothetical protein ACFSQU_09840 [Massilia sp. GCM10020059]|uniref:PsiF repeat-containing protein n=1 Tax=Massilia agrisoli TaxID=2892444 RepID=A0ABS8IP02_9BURK|nr:hypothetical protein [Massilia agrisoli]MCC6069558.1 hypothetical protein [Massilia agrisoli]